MLRHIEDYRQQTCNKASNVTCKSSLGHVLKDMHYTKAPQWYYWHLTTHSNPAMQEITFKSWTFFPALVKTQRQKHLPWSDERNYSSTCFKQFLMKLKTVLEGLGTGILRTAFSSRKFYVFPCAPELLGGERPPWPAGRGSALCHHWEPTL